MPFRHGYPFLARWVPRYRMDFSDEAINLARSLSAELNLPARFICCDIYDLPQHLSESSTCYTSYGVLSGYPISPPGKADRAISEPAEFLHREFHQPL